MIHRHLLEGARQSPNHPAIVEGERSVGYRELLARAQAFAGRLHVAGVRPGERVAVFLDKSVEAVVALYGAWTLGAVAVPINDGQRSPQVRHIVRHCQARAFVSGDCMSAGWTPSNTASRLNPSSDRIVPPRFW